MTTCLSREQLTFLLYRVLNNSLIAVAYQEYKQLKCISVLFSPGPQNKALDLDIAHGLPAS
jgi:hypothetical protein